MKNSIDIEPLVKKAIDNGCTNSQEVCKWVFKEIDDVIRNKILDMVCKGELIWTDSMRLELPEGRVND